LGGGGGFGGGGPLQATPVKITVVEY
jgi:hypothetical protein